MAWFRELDSAMPVADPIECISRIASRAELSERTKRHAAKILELAEQHKISAGKDPMGLAAAALYAACRVTETPRTLKDIGQASDTKRKDIARCYRLLRELDITMPVTDPIKCIPRIASRAELSERTKRHAAKILELAEQHKISAGKDPMGLAAAALYAACTECGENKTQRDVAEAAGVTEVTIRVWCKRLKAALGGTVSAQGAGRL